MTGRDDATVLWRLRNEGAETRCLLVSCCSGAELQLVEDETLILRELYPDRSSLHERARELRRDLETRGWEGAEVPWTG